MDRTALYDFDMMDLSLLNSSILIGVALSFMSNLYFASGAVDYGKLTLIKNGEEMKILTKTCHSGLFLKEAKTYDCACITGVWAFYPKFCEEPALIVGGKQYCFRMDNFKLRQAAIVGSYENPFMASLGHFQDTKFSQLTQIITEHELLPKTNLDAMGAWLTVSNKAWTLYNDKKESLCLKPTQGYGISRKIICKFANNLHTQLSGNTTKKMWTIVKKVELGCQSNWTIEPDDCYSIKKPTGMTGCSVFPKLNLCSVGNGSRNGTDNSTDTGGKASNDDCRTAPDFALTAKIATGNNSLSGRSLKIKRIKKIKVKEENITGYIRLPTTEQTTTEEPTTTTTTTTTTEEPPKEIPCGDVTRKSVKEYWLDPANNECARSINEAIFTDQLRRFAVTRFNEMFEARLRSLEQINQLVQYSTNILKKTCGVGYIPPGFLDVAADAFLMFVQEDFFYGADVIENESFERIVKSLKSCWKRAKSFVFEVEPLGCDIKKIKNTLILPEETVNITVPQHAKSTHFEVLIEASWKIFLNAHSYCFEDFVANDHHRFSVQFMQLFSRSIYQSWTEPLQNKNVYKFILPKHELMNEIMHNVDHCVAAAGHVSECPVWIQRSDPVTKRTTEENKVERKKRSTWESAGKNARADAIMWNGKGYCIKRMDEPASTLQVASCKEMY